MADELIAAIRAIIKAHKEFKELTGRDADCTLCNDVQWWIDNGIEAQRAPFCASQGCPISGDEGAE